MENQRHKITTAEDCTTTKKPQTYLFFTLLRINVVKKPRCKVLDTVLGLTNQRLCKGEGKNFTDILFEISGVHPVMKLKWLYKVRNDRRMKNDQYGS
jgi:hypothetical protein